MSDPAATVIVPNYNGRRFLPELIASLARQRRSDFQLFVVDDRSTDDSVAWLREHCPAARLLVNERNLGFAATINAGIRASRTPFVALLNNDTHVDPDWLSEALAAFDADDIGAVASLSLLADPPHLIDTAGDAYTVAGGGVKRLHGCPREAAATAPREAFSASGVSAFYRRAALEEVGLLDEHFESYYEDIELGWRLQWRGWRCVFAPKSIVYHHLSSSYAPTGWRQHFNSARNAEVVWWSHMSPRMRWRYLHVHLFCVALQGLAEMRRGRFRPWLSGKVDALRPHWRRRIREKRRQNERLARRGDAAMLDRVERDWMKVHIGPRLRKAMGWMRRAR
ncbi:MAG: glycosyltransferase family 2 protein [Phycisphaerae bacterium]|nr:glycosyltransferase family 2 protein [Phycisphaerae bacterium]